MASLRQCGVFAALFGRMILRKHFRSRMNYEYSFIHKSKTYLDNRSIEIKMPSLSPTMTEGTIVKWLKKEGDSVSPGDVLCEIQTDKAIVGFETEEEGILVKILIPENTTNVILGEVIALILTEEALDDASLQATKIKSETVSSVPSASDTFRRRDDNTRRLCGPSVRKLLQEYGIKYSLVPCSGPHNVVLKSDVLKYIKDNNLKFQPYVLEKSELPKAPDVTFIEKRFTEFPVTSMRKTIARRLTEAKTTIPHGYVSIDCRIDQVLKFRKKLKDEGVTVSVNDFIIKCAAVTLSKTPNLNVMHLNGEVKQMKSVDICVAVATDNGLLTPIVKNANNMNVQNISEAVKSLALKARGGKLKPEEFQGGTFTISNLGMFGISEFSAVINPPQGAILAVGTVRNIVEDALVTHKLKVTLSFDSRIISDDEAGLFLQRFKTYVENPLNVLL